MSLRRVATPEAADGALWLASMPGRFESWQAFLDERQRRAVSLILCLTPRSEIAGLAPAYERAIVGGSLPCDWLNIPLRNYGLPLDMDAFRAGIGQAATRLRAGDAVLLHCAAGIGRTGSAAVCVLKQLGVPVDVALQRVRAAGSSPENALQSGLVDWF